MLIAILDMTSREVRIVAVLKPAFNKSSNITINVVSLIAERAICNIVRGDFENLAIRQHERTRLKDKSKGVASFQVIA